MVSEAKIYHLVSSRRSSQFLLDKKMLSKNARIGKLLLEDNVISTPILWLGHRVGGNPKPWQEFQLPGVLMNAWEILSTGLTSRKVQEIGINQYLGLDESCATMLDSGGYLFLKRDNINADPEEILQLYEATTPDIGAILDYPLDPFDTVEANKQRWQKTLANTRKMFARNGHLTLMPIIHAHSVTQAKRACDELRKIVEEPLVLGIGSLVPLMRTFHDGRLLLKSDFHQVCEKSNGYKSSRHLAVEVIKVVRNEFPNSFLHVFGVGGTTTMHLMFALGVDSLDSIGWRIKAGFGAVQMPGLGDRFTGNKPKTHNRTLLKEDQKARESLLNCQCPVCQEHKTLEKRVKTLDKYFNNRALHNAWVFVEEANNFREQLEKGSVESFVYQRLQNSPLKSLLSTVFDA